MRKITLLIASLFITIGAMAQFTQSITDITSGNIAVTTEYPEGVATAKTAENSGENCNSGSIKVYQVKVAKPDASDITVNFRYTGGSHKLVILGVDVLDSNGDVVAGDYHYGYTGGSHSNNDYTLSGIPAGDYKLRYFFCHKTSDHEVGNQAATITVTGLNIVVELPEGVVAAPADITETGLYTIVPKDANRGVLFANSTSSHLTTTALANANIEDVNQQFMFITKDEKTYLYSVGANKFVNDEGQYLNLTAAPKDYVVVESADVDGHLFIKMNGSDLINVSTGWTYGAVANWNTADNGNRLRVRYVDEASEELLATVEELFNSTADVTYNFVCNDVTLATQTETVAKGEEFPAFNVTLPLGYRIEEEKPAGTVTATVSEEITVVVDNSLLPFEAVAEGTPTTWYYAQMHAHGSYHWFVAPAEDGESVRTLDHKFAAGEVDAHLWGFVGTVEGGFKMVNKATGKAIKSNNSGVAGMAVVADATSFIAMGSQAGGNYFCLRYPQGNYLNSQGNVINHWGNNDNGSSFLLTEYVDENVTVNVSEAGWATKYFAESVHVPASVNAYIVTGAENGWITKSQIAEGEVIPANTGILLENAGEHNFAKTVSYNYTLANNLLNGSVEDTYVEGTAYVLANHSAGIGFYKAELNKNATGGEGTTHFLNNAGKAYLVLPAASETVAFYGFNFGGTTGIDEITENRVQSTVIYDLQGRRVSEITEKGIYIVGGKKVLVK